MTITQRLILLDDSLVIHNEGEWSNSVSIYSAFNDAGVECEVGEFLYSMVRILKPSNVLETGTHWGIGASYMGLALKDNFLGHLDTLEFLPHNHQIASKRITTLGLDEYVKCHYIDAAKFAPSVMYQLIFLDTEPQTRFAELLNFMPRLTPGGWVFIHDLHRNMHQIENTEHGFAWPFGRIPFEMKQLIAKGQLVPVHFATPRGLTGFYKPHTDDYKW